MSLRKDVLKNGLTTALKIEDCTVDLVLLTWLTAHGESVTKGSW